MVGSDTGDEVVLDAVVGNPTQRHACGMQVLATLGAELASRQQPSLVESRGSRIHAAVVEARHVTVRALGYTGDPHVQLVWDQCEIAARARIDPVERAITCFRVAIGVVVGLLREELDGAADGVLPGQGALRSA